MKQVAHPDPFLQRMFSRMSPGAEYLFTDYQLDEIKKAFAARSFGEHAIDYRFSIKIFRSSFYAIFLAGRERRLRSRPLIGVPRFSLVLPWVAITLFLLLAA